MMANTYNFPASYFDDRWLFAIITELGIAMALMI